MNIDDIDKDDLSNFLSCAAAYTARKTNYDEKYGDMTEDFHVISSSIQLPSNSSIGVLLNSRHDGSYKVHLGLKVAEFDVLHDLFKTEYLEKTRADNLHPLETELVLALALKWRHDKRGRSVLGLLFGVDEETINRGVQLGSDILDNIHTYNQYSRRR